MKLYEEFKEYENMWDHLLEWKAMSTNATSNNTSTASSNTNTSSATSSSQATSNNNSTTSASSRAKSILNKKKAASPRLGYYSAEFKKLRDHLDTLHTVDYNYKYSFLGDHHLCVVFETNNGVTYYLDVTTTKLNSSNFSYSECWDYVLQEMQPNNHIIGRGYLADYDALLDLLLKHKLITNKAACV